MCGIVGYVGDRPVQELLLAGLEKLEYRGYDSAGISLRRRRRRSSPSARSATSARCATPSAQPERPSRRRGRGGRAEPATTGIGHTRWATHGRVTEENAHPHFDTADRVHIVVNGIVENFMALESASPPRARASPPRPTPRSSPTSSPRHYDGDLAAAVRAAYAELEGHYAFVAMAADEPDLLVGARKECPLIVGRGEGEQFLASAIPAFLAHTRRRPVHRERRDRRRRAPTASRS